MPLPLAMMIPFMGIQSSVMAKQFGENFQYGKRRISAMSNEEFNKLTPAKLQDNANKELKAMIPSMEQSVIEMRTFQTFLIKEFLQMLNDAIGAGLGKLFGFDETTIFPPGDTTAPPTLPPTQKPPTGGQLPFPPTSPTFPPYQPPDSVAPPVRPPSSLPSAGARERQMRDGFIKLIASWVKYEKQNRDAFKSHTLTQQRTEIRRNRGHYKLWNYMTLQRKATQRKLTDLLQRYDWR